MFMLSVKKEAKTYRRVVNACNKILKFFSCFRHSVCVAACEMETQSCALLLKLLKKQCDLTLGLNAIM